MSSRPSARSPLLHGRARQMRIAPTASEAMLWAALRGSRLGVGFRRQAVIGSYIVDFLAPSVRLIIEVDGGYHTWRARADERQDRIFWRAGYRIIRFSALQVSINLPGVILAIAHAIEEAR
jgi:very-short-patch-repair endonuclease